MTNSRTRAVVALGIIVVVISAFFVLAGGVPGGPTAATDSNKTATEPTSKTGATTPGTEPTVTPPSEPFITPAPDAPDNQTVEIALWGDTHWGNVEGDGAGNDIVDSVRFIRARNPEYVLHLGDVTSDADPWAFDRAAENFTRVTRQTGADQIWYTPGGTHDGFADGASFKSADGGLDYGLATGFAFMRNRSLPSFLYAVEVGNTAFITVPSYHAGNVVNSQTTQFTVIEPWRAWLERQLAYYETKDYNTVVYSHAPLYQTNQHSEDWSAVGSPKWQETSVALKRLFAEYDVDAYLSSHIHTDTDTHYDGGSAAKSGKVVNGSRYPGMVNTTYVGDGVINWEHGKDRVNADRPTMFFATLNESSNALVLRGYDVRNGTRTAISTNDNGTVPIVEIPFDDEVDLGPVPERPDGYRQGWMPVAMANASEPYRDETRFQDGGLSVRSKRDWWTSVWRYPYGEAVPASVETTHNKTELTLDHEYDATIDGDTEPYSFGTNPVDRFIVNTSVTRLRTQEAFVANYSLSYRVVFEHVNATYRNGRYVLGGARSGAAVRIYEPTTLSRLAGVTYRVADGTTATVGNVSMTATAGPVEYLPRKKTGSVRAAFVHRGPPGTTYTVENLSDGHKYAVRRNGTRSDVVTATGGRVTVEATASDQRIVLRQL